MPKEYYAPVVTYKEADSGEIVSCAAITIFSDYNTVCGIGSEEFGDLDSDEELLVIERKKRGLITCPRCISIIKSIVNNVEVV